MSLAMGGGESISQVGSDSFSFVSGNEIFSGTGFNGNLTPPMDPGQVSYMNRDDNPHGARGHGIFKITCKNSGAVDYFPKGATASVYAVADGEVSAAYMTYYNKNGNTGSIIELRHSGSPSCSSYAHVTITSELITEIKKVNPSFGGRDHHATVIPESVHIIVKAGQKIAEIAQPRRSFSQHLHFQLDGASESQLKAAMNALKGGS